MSSMQIDQSQDETFSSVAVKIKILENIELRVYCHFLIDFKNNNFNNK